MPATKSKSTNRKPENPIQLLKEATCPTSSGKSTLGYQVGADEHGAIHIKVSSNDGGGFFSNEWIAYSDIQAALEAWPEDQGVTSMTFRKIFRGKSANTPGFLIAVLCAEGLIEPVEGKKRVHQACDPSRFLAEASALQGGSSKSPEGKAKTAPKAKAKAPAKRAANTDKTPRKAPANSRKGK